MGKRHTSRKKTETMNDSQRNVARLREAAQAAARFSDPVGNPLPDSDLAKAIGVKKSAFSGGINKYNDYFGPDKLIQLIASWKNSSKSIRKAVVNEAIRLVFEKIAATSGFKKQQLYNTLKSTNIQFLSGATSAIIILGKKASIKDYLPAITRYNSLLKELTIAVPIPVLSQVIDDVENWAYGANGNYTDTCTIHLFLSGINPDYTLLGGIITGEFVGLIEQDDWGVLPAEVLMPFRSLYELQLNIEPDYSVFTKPEARFIERLRRELAADISSDINSFLVEYTIYIELADYDAHKNTESILQRCCNILIPEARACLTSESAKQLESLLTALYLSAI